MNISKEEGLIQIFLVTSKPTLGARIMVEDHMENESVKGRLHTNFLAIRSKDWELLGS
jgi:hypothetical protein